MQMENCAQLLARRSRIMQTTIKICASFFGVAHSLLFLASGHASVHGHPPKGECKMRIFMGWGRNNVRQFNVGWHTNPQSCDRLLLPLPTPLNSPFCALSLLLHVTYVLPLPHMAVTYVRQTGPLLCAADGNANWSRVRSLTQQPSANALNSARAGGLQRGVCVIFVAYKATCTWPQRNYLRPCQRWGITFALC